MAKSVLTPRGIDGEVHLPVHSARRSDPHISFRKANARETRRYRQYVGERGEGGKVDWAKVHATTEADIARHARETYAAPSDREWRKMVREGRVKLVPPASVDVRVIRESYVCRNPNLPPVSVLRLAPCAMEQGAVSPRAAACC